jgi:hypothetical protein
MSVAQAETGKHTSKTSAPFSGKSARIDALLQGAIDPHVHSGPSIAPRALDHLDLV